MSGKETKPSPKPVSASTSAAPAKQTRDLGKAQLQQAADEVAEQGYFGTVPDETPNADYTVAGVTKKAGK